MANSSLGIYIDDGIIKYAKLQRDKDEVKVEAFNVIFYDNLEREINKIITETGSTKTPICLNLSNESYNYLEVISMMQQKDRAQSIKIDFDTICEEKGMNSSDFEARYLLTEAENNPDKLVALHVSVEKDEISKLANIFAGKKIESIRPITTSIINLVDLTEKENVVIVNLEEKAKITTIIDGMISRIDVLQVGMKNIIDTINETENSERKAYEVLKNTTIYTEGNSDMDTEGNEHVDEIMPVLFDIMQETKNIIENCQTTIHKIYITGLGAAINNIDLFFQEYAVNAKCEILRPFFLKSTTLNTSFKDYIEVNSAIALALDGIGYCAVEEKFNFKKNSSISFNAKSLLSGGPEVNMDLKGPLQPDEKVMLRICGILAIAIIAYVIITNSIINRIEEMKTETDDNISAVSREISKADTDVQAIQAQADHYAQIAEVLKNLEEHNEQVLGAVPEILPRSIPLLLKSISNVIPKDVVLLSLKNTEDKHIVIEVVAPDYDQIGYFKALIAKNTILLNVKSSSGEKVTGYSQDINEKWVYVTIEGDLQ